MYIFILYNVGLFFIDAYFYLFNNKVHLLHKYWRAVSINMCLVLFHKYFFFGWVRRIRTIT